MHIQCPLAGAPARSRIKIAVPILPFPHIGGRVCPELGAAQPEVRVRGRLIPKHLILQLVGLGVVINDETLEILRALVHDLAEGIEIREHTCILLVELAAVAHNVLPQNEDKIDIRAQIRGNADRILHSEDKHGVHVTAVHEQIADILVAHPGWIIETVIQDQKIPRIHSGRAPLGQILGDLLGNELLALQDIGDHERGILFVNEERRHNLTVELVSALCARDHRATGHALIMPEEILYQEGLACLTLAYEHHDLVVLNAGHVEFPKPEVQALGATCS